MKGAFLKKNDLIKVLWGGRFVFLFFLVLSVVVSSAYSYYYSQKYFVYTILESDDVAPTALIRIKRRVSERYYVFSMAEEFSKKPETFFDFEINVMKYYLHPELSVLSSFADIEQNKKYLEFFRYLIKKDMISLSTNKDTGVMLEDQAKQIENYKQQISDTKALLALYERRKNESAAMLKNRNQFMDMEKEINDNSSFEDKFKLHVLNYIAKNNEYDVVLFERHTSSTKKRLEDMKLRLTYFERKQQLYKEQIGSGVLGDDIVSVSKDITVEPNEVDWGKNFILFFFAMMFFALGLVFVKEIGKE